MPQSLEGMSTVKPRQGIPNKLNSAIPCRERNSVKVTQESEYHFAMLDT